MFDQESNPWPLDKQSSALPLSNLSTQKQFEKGTPLRQALMLGGIDSDAPFKGQSMNILNKK